MDPSLKILILDDEEIIVDITTQMVQRLGFPTEGHTTAQTALEAFRKSPGDYGLVITDLTMPDITGDRLAVEIKAIRNGVPIILCTGYSDVISEAKAKEMGIREYVMKPILIKDLAAAIRRAVGKNNDE